MTPRQLAILKALIEEYLQTADVVGSTTLVNKYGLKVSPATVRNEMSTLTNEGYLVKTHFSAGRQPTPIGFRHYVEDILEETILDHLETVRAKQIIHAQKHNRERLIKEAVQQLVQLTKMTAIGITDSAMFYGGISHLIGQPEFCDIHKLQRVMNIIEDLEMLKRIFTVDKVDGVKIVIGPEFGFDALKDCAVVYKSFNYYRDQKGYIGVFGPTRMNYKVAVPAVRFVSDVLSSAVVGW